jgi:hypothetical protein
VVTVYDVNSEMRVVRDTSAGIIKLSEKWVRESPNLPCGSEPEEIRAPARGNVLKTKDGELYGHFKCGNEVADIENVTIGYYKL